MENFININVNNVYSIMNSLPEKSTYVFYEDEESHKIMLEGIELINMVNKGDGYIYEANHLFDLPSKTAEIPQYEKEGYYRLTSSIKNMIPLALDDMFIDKKVQQAKSDKSIVKALIHQNLKKIARKACNRAGIKFRDTDEGIFFDGHTKEKPIFKQMEEAFNEGSDTIVFDGNLVSISSVRHYAWQIGNLHSKKISVSASEGIITVRFKAMDMDSKLREEIKSVFSRMSSEYGDKKVMEFSYEFYNDLMWNNVVTEKETDTDIIDDETQEFRYLSQVDDEFAGQEKEAEETEKPFWGHNADKKPEHGGRFSETEPEHEISEVTGYQKIKLPPELENEQPLTQEDLSWGKSVRPEPKTYYNPDADGSNFINDPDFQPNEQGEFWATVDGKRVWMDDMGEYITEAEKLERDSQLEDDDF